jgi:DNA-binding NarL/FixJ family response regulator
MWPVGVVPVPALVGREVELEQLDRFLGSIPAGSRAVLLCGAAGAGKTTVWRAALERAEALEVRVLRARCAEVEMPIAFGALADLLEAAFGEVEAQLPDLQREALALAVGRAAASEASDSLLLGAAVLSCLRVLAGPLLLAIDDLQWLDVGSRRMLAYALRRIGDTPVGLIATLREGEASGDPLSLADALPPGRFERIELGPLSAGALQRVISDRLGVHLPRPTLSRVQQASGGNPMFALEFARSPALRERGGRAAPLEVPTSLEQLVRARITELPDRLRPLLEVVSALERATLPVVEQALAGRAVSDLLEEAVRSDVLVLDGEVVRFTHPLFASTVYFGISPTRRRELHSRLAEIVDGVEERGRHAALATAEPEAPVAAIVEQAAWGAAGRGALDAAAELAGEAARLTPVADRDTRRQRALLAAGWLVDTGEFTAARAALEPLLTSDLPAGVRAEALLLRAECELGDRRALVALLREALDVAEQRRQRWQALIRYAHHGGWVSGNAELAADTARESLRLAEGLDDPALVASSSAALAFYEAARGRPEAMPSTRPDRRPLSPPRMQWWQISPAVSLGCRLLWAGEFAPARSTLEHELEVEDRAGRDAKAGFVLCLLSELEWRAGDWQRAERLAAEATARLGDINPTAFPRALVAAFSGRADEAGAIAEGALGWAEAFDEHVAQHRFRWLLGLLELAQDDAARAHDHLAVALTNLDAAGIRNPGYVPVLPDLAEALTLLGRPDEAEPIVARLETAAAALDHAWATPAARRSRALLQLARRDSERAVALATAAADAFATLPAPLDRGRALLVAGQAQRRLGERRQAARSLEQAAELFAALPAPLWHARAERERRRASPRPRHDRDQLTAAETRVAARVAGGRTNKEVAAELYTTVATVEAHLTRIYRKLGIRSRSELTRRVAAGTLRLDDDEESGFP